MVFFISVRFAGIPYPDDDYMSGRKIRTTPLYSRVENDTVFGQIGGFERPQYYIRDQDGKLVLGMTKQSFSLFVRSLLCSFHISIFLVLETYEPLLSLNLFVCLIQKIEFKNVHTFGNISIICQLGIDIWEFHFDLTSE